jgi:hypothetical protein
LIPDRDDGNRPARAASSWTLPREDRWSGTQVVDESTTLSGKLSRIIYFPPRIALVKYFRFKLPLPPPLDSLIK